MRLINYINNNQKKFFLLLLFLTFFSTIFLYHVIEKKWILFNKAEIFFNAKQYNESASYYERSIKEGLINPIIYINLIDSYLKLNQKKKLKSIIYKFNKQYFYDTNKIVKLIDLLNKHKEYNISEKILNSALKAKPNNRLLSIKLARVLSWQKNYDASIQQYRKLLGT